MKVQRRVTTSEIAKAVGVSRATVSYVLNDRPDSGIAEATAQRIRDTARQLGYVPSAAARMLRSGRSNLVLGLLPTWDLGPTYPQIFRGLGERLARLGYEFVLHSAGNSAGQIDQLLKCLTPALVVSLQALSGEARKLLDRAGIRNTHIDLVAFVSRAGSTQVDYLADLGYQRLIYVQPDHYIPDVLSTPRIAAMLGTARQRGIPDPRVVKLPYTAAGIALFEDEHLSDTEPPGLCAHTDEVAAFLYASLGKERFGCRPRIGLVGVGDRPIASLGITTVRLDIEQWADVWSEPLLDILGHGTVSTTKTRAQTMEVIVRQSA
jgi:DNA-binding LacI/PurR family transcriptional regulator